MIEKARLGTFLAGNPFPNGLTDGLFYREKMRAIHRIAPAQLRERAARPASILEIGGGRSGLARLLYPEALVTTLDRDGTLLRQAPQAGRVKPVCGDALALPFGNGCFDAVTLFDVLEHIHDDARAAREAWRVTKPGGWVLVSTPQTAWRYPFYRVMRRWCPPEQALMDEWGHVRRGYRVAQLGALFGRSPLASATFINPVTAFYHDIAFSRLRRRWRLLLYLLAAPPTALGYWLHGPSSPGTEVALAWQRPPEPVSSP